MVGLHREAIEIGVACPQEGINRLRERQSMIQAG
jgi:hypothetical protein